jgi:hypothetical protein
LSDWLVPGKIHPAPKEGISAVRRRRGKLFVGMDIKVKYIRA